MFHHYDGGISGRWQSPFFILFASEELLSRRYATTIGKHEIKAYRKLGCLQTNNGPTIYGPLCSIGSAEACFSSSLFGTFYDGAVFVLD